jgi:hypothetical protein
MPKALSSLLLFCCVGLLIAAKQTTGSAAASKAPARIILDVVATQYEFGPDWNYQYVRVFSDGRAEAQTFQRESVLEKPRLTTVQATLSHERLAAVEHLIDDAEVMHLDSRYPQRVGDILDVFTVWHIKLQHSRTEQRLDVVEFAPDEAKRRNHPYPTALLKLGCTVAIVRAATISKPVRPSECQSAEP